MKEGFDVSPVHSNKIFFFFFPFQRGNGSAKTKFALAILVAVFSFAYMRVPGLGQGECDDQDIPASIDRGEACTSCAPTRSLVLLTSTFFL